MRLADYSAGRRREIVALALDFCLQDLAEPTDTFALAAVIGKRLDTKETRDIARMIVSWAPRIPEAAKGDTFVKYGKVFQHWVWYPKGRTIGGAQTRQARRELAWRGKVYATPAELESAKEAAGVWEVS
jgi:hypothetical protein